MLVRQILRSLFSDRLNTAVILISMAVGMACINTLILFIKEELRTDDFQTNADRIYLLKCDDPFNKGSKMFSTRLGAAEFMKSNFSQVEDFCRIKRSGAAKVLVNGQVFSDSPVVYEASSNFFTFFSYELLTNNPATVLETKNDIAISEELAKKYFGNPLPVGKIITLINGETKSEYIIKGVFRKPAVNTQLHFDMVKFTNESERYAYLLLKKNADPAELEDILDENKEKIPSINDGTPGRYYLESLKQAYFDTAQDAPPGPVRDKSDLWIAFIIGFMIISVASFNYLGLINNKLLDKSKEFYVKRINGATKARLVAGFLFESLIILTFSFALSLEIITWILPFFNNLVSSNIDIRSFLMADQLLTMAGLVIFLLLITMMFSLSRINSQSVSLKRTFRISAKGKIIHIPVFNIFQIAVTLTLLVSSLTIIKQMNYISNINIGLDKDIVEIKLPAQYKANVFKEEIIKNPAVAIVSVTPASPLLEYMLASFHYSDNGVEKQYTPAIFMGDENFINTLGIKLTDGRNFSGNSASEKNSCIINEALARKFADLNLVGTKLPGDNDLTVIGIVSDFHYSSLKELIAPGIIIFNNSGNHLLVRPTSNQSAAMEKAIKETWQRLIPDYPPNMESVRERFEWYHKDNKNYAKLIGSCCIISLLLSMMGLFAISFSAGKKRTKETGIRKINGATILQVMTLLNKDFVRWVVIAYIISIPFAFFIMHKWLQNYAYKTALSWEIFVSAGLIAIGIALITVSWQTYRTATKNPVDSLRYE